MMPGDPMQLSEDLIRNVVQQVLFQMGSTTPLPPTRSTGTWGVFATVDEAVSAAEEAFQEFRKRPLADRDKAVQVIKSICLENAEELGKKELEETKIGRLDHKIAKLNVFIPVMPGVENLKTLCDSGDAGLTLTDFAPFGVIGAVTPVTHSLPTLACNGISMLASGNTVVFNAHPSGQHIAAEGVRRFNQGIARAIGIENLLTIVHPPTLETAQALFAHKGVKLLVVTGGPAVARAALGSSRRAVVAGPGNPPVVVDATACLDNAAKSIIHGAAFDNNLLCIGEKQVFAVAEVFDKLLDAMSQNGGYRLSPLQIEALTRAAFVNGSDGKPHVNKDFVGKDPEVLAQAAGVSLPKGTQLLFGETGVDHPFVQEEQMMPFVPFVRVNDVERAIELARQTEHGFGHTAILHSRDTAVMQRMGRIMNCTIFVVNGPSTAGLSAPAVGSFSIAGPTGEGVTTPATFTRQRRTAVVGSMRFL